MPTNRRSNLFERPRAILSMAGAALIILSIVGFGAICEGNTCLLQRRPSSGPPFRIGSRCCIRDTCATSDYAETRALLQCPAQPKGGSRNRNQRRLGLRLQARLHWNNPRATFLLRHSGSGPNPWIFRSGQNVKTRGYPDGHEHHQEAGNFIGSCVRRANSTCDRANPQRHKHDTALQD